MRKHWNRKGFTLAEVLIVVAIIVVLMGVGFIALMSHMRNMQKLEMDGQAKEIFVAAQNHLTMAKSQDYLGLKESDGTFGTAEDANAGIYYFVVNENVFKTEESGYEAIKYNSPNNEGGVLNQLLPFASVNEAARTGGSYIIRYQKDPAQILDVFYVSTTGRYGLASGLSAENDYTDAKLKGYIAGTSDVNLKEYGATKAVVGYYGGGTAGVPTGEKLKTPGLEVINGDKLEVKVTDYNGTSNDGNELVLVIKSGTASLKIQLIGTGADSDANKGRVTPPTGNSGTYAVVLDDVTKDGQHFANLMSTAAGSNIEIVAIAYNNKLITNIAESPTLETNSLFASMNGSTVEIASIRHLLNLDSAISNLSASVTVAKQISDLVWDDGNGDATDNGCFLDNTHGADTQIYPFSSSGSPSAEGSYMPVSAPSDLEYQGLDRTNHIIGITVTGGTGNAGLFSGLTGGKVSNLELVDFNVSAAGNVGALAGSASGTEITSVLVHNSKIGGAEPSDPTADRPSSGADKAFKIESTAGAAGGLVGKMDGGTVNTSAAAVYVVANGDAGGLIGLASGTVNVNSCYSGGHTENAKYAALSPAGDTTVVNVQSDGGHAGGLIGHASGTLTVSYSYSTASASSKGGSVGIGGLVGKTDNAATITNCYAVGLVTAPADSTASISPFVVGSLSSTSTGNYYLTGVSPMAVTPGEGVTAVSSGDTSSSLILLEGARSDAIPYDATLTMNYKGKFFFPTVAQLGGTVTDITNIHYGDWQIPGLVKLNFQVDNGDTLDLKIELLENTEQFTIAISGDSSGNTRFLVLKAERNSDKTIKGLTLVKEGYVDGTAFKESADKRTNTDYANSLGILQTRITSRFKPDTPRSKDGKTLYDVHLTLDDITTSYGHFAQLFACDSINKSKNLWPGENITVRLAGGDCGWAELAELDFYDKVVKTLTEEEKTKLNKDFNWCAKADNSLYFGWNNYTGANHEDYVDLLKNNDAQSTTVYIKNLRHLQNLDSSTSYANILGTAVTRAELLNSIDYKTEKTRFARYAEIYSALGNTSVKNAFNGIYNPELTSLSGISYAYDYINGKYNKNEPKTKAATLRNFAIKGTTDAYAEIYQLGSTDADTGNTFGSKNAGLFRYVKTGASLTVADLYLADPDVSGSEYVGAVVASNHGTVKLDTVLVAGETASVDATGTGSIAIAGGLVGYSGGNGTKLDVINSAASVLIKSNGGPAGGLLGRQNGGTVQIYASYVGGRTGYYALNDDNDYVYVGGEYYQGSTADPGEVTVTVEGVDETYDRGRWNIISAGGAAGGLIGEITSGTTGIEKSFNTASVFSGGSNKAGGIAGAAMGTFAKISNLKDANDVAISTSSKVLELVYTVAPVANVNRNVKSGEAFPYVPAAGKGGAVFGERSDTAVTDIENLYYQADFYSEVEFNDAQTATNISYLGSGGAVSTVTLASYYADESAAGAAIIGLYSNQDENLEVSTTAYDDYLTKTSAGDANSQEYPFAIWTTFAFEASETAQITHFYGDWQPVKREKSEKFVFYFMKELPSDSSATTTVYEDFYTLADTNGNGTEAQLQAQNERWMAIQTIPYVETELAIPTLPYIPGYDYGSKLYAPGSGKAYAFDSGEELASTEDHYVWTLYVGDQRTALIAMSTRSTAEAAKYSALGNGIILPEQYLKDALAAVEGTTNDPTLTLVAHYNKLDDQYTVTLMDYDPTRTEEGGTPKYERLSLQVLNKADYTDGITFGKVQAKDGLKIPRRNRPNYTFLGWYTQDTDTKIYGYTNGQIELVNADYPITKDTVLIAKYQKVEYGTIEIDFIMDGSGLVLAPTYSLQYEKETTFDMDIPLPSEANMKGIRITEGTGTSQTPDASFVKVSANSDYIKAIHIKYTGSENRHYYVYVQTTENAVAYVVRCKMMDTEGTGGIVTLAALGGAYKAGSDAMLDPYAGQNLLLLTSEGGDLNAETYIQAITIPGFEYNGENDVIEVTSSTTGYGLPDGNTITADGETYNIGYVLMLSYDRIKYTLSYTNTETSIRSKKIAYGDNIVIPANPSYSGWQFDYWSYKEGENDVTATAQTLMPARDLALIANWKAAKTDFTVAIWLENLNYDPTADDKDNYFMLESVEVKDAVYPGTKITRVRSNDNGIVLSADLNNELSTIGIDYVSDMEFDSDAQKKIKFFTGDRVTMSDTEIKQDGSTIVNVYFKRNTYTLRFDVGFSQRTGGTGANAPHWGKKAWLEEYSNEPTYGVDENGDFVLLTKDGDEWKIPTYERIVLPADAVRYKKITDINDNGGQQFTDTLQPLEQKTAYIRTGSFYTYTINDEDYGSLSYTEYNNLHGIANNTIKRVYWRDPPGGGVNPRWQTQNNNNNYTDYTGTRYIRTSVTGPLEYPADGTLYTANNNGFTAVTGPGPAPGTKYGKLTDSSGNDYYFDLPDPATTVWYIKDTTDSYSGTRYRKGEANDCNQYYQGGEWFTVTYDAVKHEWYYIDMSAPASLVTYVGDKYIDGILGGTTSTYYISHITNATQDGGYDGFFTQGRDSLGNTNPFTEYSYKCKDYQVGADYYTTYYLEVTAKYEERIANQWPAALKSHNNGAYNFVGWIQNDQSKLCIDQVAASGRPSSIKGSWETMDENVLLIQDTSEYGYGTTTVPGVAHEFHCRYSGTVRPYVYRLYFQKDNGSFDRAHPDMQIQVNGGQTNTGGGSEPRDQSAASFTGFVCNKDLGHIKAVYKSNGVESEENLSSASWSGHTYTVNLPQGGTATGMYINMYYYKSQDDIVLMYVKDGKKPVTFDTILCTYGESGTNIRTLVNSEADLDSIDGYSSDGTGTYTFEGWYDNKLCTGDEYAFDETMPGGKLILYAKLTHKPVTVKFYKEDGTTEYTALSISNHPYGSTLETYLGSGAYVLPDYDSTDGKYTFEFLYWQDKESGEEWVRSDKVEDDLELVPVFEKVANPEATSVTVYFLKYDKKKGEDLSKYAGYKTDSSLWAKEKATRSTYYGSEDPILVGKLYSEPAANINGYYPIRLNRSCKVQADGASEIVHFYEAPVPWSFKVEYYIQLQNIENPTWASATTETAVPILIYTDPNPHTTTGKFALFGYSVKEGMMPWAAQYEFLRYEYNGTEVPGNSPFVMLKDDPDSTADNILKVYLVPDSDAIFIEDHTATYDGDDHAGDNDEYSSIKGNLADSPLWVPAGAKVTVNYLYYDMSDPTNPKEVDEVIDAKTYGVRAYIIVTYGGKDYLVWESEDTGDNKPPLHLYINRRIVFLYSAYGRPNQATASGPVLFDHDVLTAKYVYTKPSEGPANGAQGELQFLLDRLGLSEDEIGFAKTADEAAMNYIWSANAFRRMSGKSPNVFSYTVDADVAGNYNFYSMFGELEIP